MIQTGAGCPPGRKAAPESVKAEGSGSQAVLYPIKSFYAQLFQAADQYVDAKTLYGYPSTGDGATRVQTAKDCAAHCRSRGRAIEKAAVHFTDRELPMAKRIQFRQAELDELNNALEKQRAVPQAEAENHPRQKGGPAPVNG